MSEQLPVQTVSKKNPYQVTDPQSQAGLTEVIEAGQIPVRYINKYHTNHDVRCAFCDKHTPHRRGFTAIMKDGRIALCGIDCGRHYFGEEVARNFEKALQKTEEEADRDAILEAAMEDLPVLYEEVCKKWVPLEQSVRSIINALPTFPGNVLKRQTDDNGDFIISDVEVRWFEMPDGSKKPIETKVELGRVKYAKLLQMNSSRFYVAQKNMSAILNGRDHHNKIIHAATRYRHRMSLTQVLDDALQYLEVAALFLTQDNIRQYDKAIRHYRVNYGTKVDWKRKGDGPGVVRVRDWSMEWEKFEIPDLSNIPNLADLAPPIRSAMD